MKWEGKYWDTNGRGGELALEEVQDASAVSGSVTFDVIDEEFARPIAFVYRGTVATGTVALALDDARGRLDGQQTTPASYARYSRFGTYTVVGSRDIGEGVWIAWRFG